MPLQNLANAAKKLEMITFSAAEQFEAAAEAARRGLGRAKVYDLLTLKCVLKAGTERVYALKSSESLQLAPDDLRDKTRRHFMGASG